MRGYTAPRMYAIREWIFERLRRGQFLLTQFSLGRWSELSRTELLLLYPLVLTIQVFRELVRDRGLVRASSLAFTTVLSVVPLLTVITTVLGAFGAGETVLKDLLLKALPGGQASDLLEHITRFAHKQGTTLSGVGAIVLIILGVLLFNNIEGAFNDIWRIRKRRSVINKFLTFYALITLAPLTLTISIAETARVQLLIEDLPFVASLFYKLLPVGLACLTFALANKLIPYTEVRWVPAIVSGLVTGIAFEVAKFGFNIYVDTFVLQNYNAVYGAIGLVPIFLVWVYVSWVIVLFGAELSYTIQNLRNLLLPERLHDLYSEDRRQYAPLLGIEVFTPVAEAFKRNEGPIKSERIAALASVPVGLTREVLDQLVKGHVVLEIEPGQEGGSNAYLPARPLEDISLLEVLSSARKSAEGSDMPELVRHLGVIHTEKERELLAGLTTAVLVDVDHPDRRRLGMMAEHHAGAGGADVSQLPALQTT
jgi:membrane protein